MGISPMTSEPALYGTLGRNAFAVAHDLFSCPFVSMQEESVAGYPLGESTALDIPINCAILDLNNHGILADIHRLCQFDQREQDLYRWNQCLEKHEEFVLAERHKYFNEKRKIT
jgi:hypothetical protein